MRILSATSTQDVADWTAAWLRTKHREPQAHPTYALGMAPIDSATWCALLETDSGSVMLPFHVREIPSEDRYFDAITPYGYGGAYSDGTLDPSDFWRQWDAWAHETQIISLTTRRHLFDEEILPQDGTQFSPLDNVVINLERTPEEIWASFKGRARTDIRKAQKLGVTVEVDQTGEGIEDFHEIYIETMKRNGASDYYLFGLDKIKRIVDDLGDAAVLFHAYLDGVKVASEIQLLGTKNAYYFLSGTTEAGRTSRASALIRLEAINWLHSHGNSRYVLGGGLTKDDPLFSYKKAYAPEGSVPFTIDYREVSSSTVEEITNRRKLSEPSWLPVGNYYPAYRAPDQSRTNG
jgi:hypothetical protein